jgi:hypothetical protein
MTTLRPGLAGARIPAEKRNCFLPRNFQNQRSSHSMGVGRVLQRLKWPGREADHTPPSIFVVTNEWSFTSNSSLCVHSVDRDNFNFFNKFVNFLVIFNTKYTYLLTLWNRVLLEKLTGFHLFNRFSTLYGPED